MAKSDEFIVYDSCQYTVNDWRNRNQVKTHDGVRWITVPVITKGRFGQRITEAEVVDHKWVKTHLGNAHGRAEQGAATASRRSSSSAECYELSSQDPVAARDQRRRFLEAMHGALGFGVPAHRRLGVRRRHARRPLAEREGRRARAPRRAARGTSPGRAGSTTSTSPTSATATSRSTCSTTRRSARTRSSTATSSTTSRWSTCSPTPGPTRRLASHLDGSRGVRVTTPTRGRRSPPSEPIEADGAATPTGPISTGCARSRCTSSCCSTPGIERLLRRLHRRRRVLRAVGLPRHPAAAARRRRAAARSGSAASTRAGSGGCCPAAFVALIVTAVVFTAISSPVEVAGAVGSFKAAFLYVGELVLHPPRERLLRRRHLDEPGAAVLVAGGRGAVLPALAADARRHCSCSSRRLDPPPPDARDPDRGRGRRRRLGGLGARRSKASNPEPRLLRHRRPRLRAARRRAARAHARIHVDWAKRFGRSMRFATFAGVGARSSIAGLGVGPPRRDRTRHRGHHRHVRAHRRDRGRRRAEP